MGFICGLTDPKYVLIAALSTLAMTLALTLYAFTTDRDFTMCGGTLFILACALLIFAILIMFTDIYILYVIYNCLGIILYGFYLVYDT